jgi:Zn-finger nucleic acid-binding protein
MNCANCGAALEPVGNRNYFRCPYCQTFMFPEETGDGIAVVGGDAQYACPVCGGHLTRAAIDGYEVSYCRVCRGFLASNATFSRIVLLERAKHGGEARVPLPFAPEELKRRIKCPRCRKPMDTHPYHAGGNAVIDTCERCHLVWLDAGELAVIGRYPARGGTTAERAGLTEPDPVPERKSESSAIHLFGFRIKPR